MSSDNNGSAIASTGFIATALFCGFIYMKRVFLLQILTAIGEFLWMLCQVVFWVGVAVFVGFLIYAIVVNIREHLAEKRAEEEARLKEHARLVQLAASHENESSRRYYENLKLEKRIEKQNATIKSLTEKLKTPEDKALAADAETKNKIDAAIHEILGGDE